MVIRRLVCLLSVLFLFLCIQEVKVSANSQNSPIKVFLNTEELTFTAPPLVKNGTTLVPFRGLFEALGMEVGWDPTKRLVTGTSDQMTISLVLGEKKATVNGKTYTLPQAATAVNGHTLVPLRFIGEATGAAVFWDPYNREISVVTVEYMQKHNIDRKVLEDTINDYLAKRAEEEAKKKKSEEEKNKTPKAPTTPINLDQLMGMYAGFRMDFGGYECGGACWDIYTFLPNKKVFIGTPANGGPETIDCTKEKCLGYTISNGQLKLSDGTSLPIKKSDHGFLVINGVTLEEVQPVKQTTFQDNYKHISYTGLIGVSGGSTSKTTYLTLNKDGSFELTGITIGNVGGIGGTDGSSSGGTVTGTYKVQGNTITFTAKDGSVTKSLFFIHNGDPTDIQIGNKNYYSD